MAKQTGDIIIEGIIDGITFYKIEGKGYARSKSSLKGEGVKRGPRFRRTMQSAQKKIHPNRAAIALHTLDHP